jgi:hypothetical protein
MSSKDIASIGSTTNSHARFRSARAGARKNAINLITTSLEQVTDLELIQTLMKKLLKWRPMRDF